MKRVLVVDDARTIRAFVRHALESVPGVEVSEAVNGVEALERALRDGADLLIVDVNMPKMDGHALLRDLRRHPDLLAIPAIMATTEDRPADRQRAFALGANLYLPKPLDADVLRACVSILAGEAA